MKRHTKAKVFVAMSGGVDSSVAAYLLKRQGYDVVGVFMRCFNLDGCAEQDSEDARRVAEKIGIPFYVWDFEEAYKRKVVDYMVEGYREGLTPNPDVMCNKEIKFGLFFEKARAMGAEYVATGHYVRLAHNFKFQISVPSGHLPKGDNFQKENRKTDNKKNNYPLQTTHYRLFSARDTQKDQSYFLWTLTQQQLAHCLFPIGDHEKSEVRKIARDAGLSTAEKKDSQGICFLGKVAFADFLKEYIPPRKGAVVGTDGVAIGEHDGAYFYTVGQRRIGVASRPLCKSASTDFCESRSKGREASDSQNAHRKHRDMKPLYVAQKDVVANTLVVAEGSDHPALYKSKVILADVNFISPELSSCGKFPAGTEIPLSVRIRYRQPLVPATLLVTEGKWSLVFERPQKAVASGQSAVFYSAEKGSSFAKALEGKEMIGGGVIADVA